MSDVPVEQLPVGQDPVLEANQVVNNALTHIGLPLSPNPGTPTAPAPATTVNWPIMYQKLSADWPGYPWPQSYNSELVAAIFADILGRLGSETQYEFFTTLALQLEANLLYHMIVVLQTDVSALAGSSTTVQQISGLSGDLANLQTEINNVAAAAWSNLWSLYNNQVVPLVQGAEQAAWSNLWSLYNNQVRPLVDATAQQAFNNLWALYNNQVVPLVQTEAANRAAGDTLISQGLTQETAARQQGENTLQMGLQNEAVARSAGDAQITNLIVPGAIAGLLAQLQPQIDNLRTEADTCLAPLCDTVTPNAAQLGRLGSLLKGLEAAGFLGLLADLIHEAATDPGQLSRDIEADLAAPVRDAVAGFRDLAGI